MPDRDLRDWLQTMAAAGAVTELTGAHWDEEIGLLTDLCQRDSTKNALLFDEIPGYPRGYRVLANVLTNTPRVALTFGLPATTTPAELVEFWRRCLSEQREVAPEWVKTGPVLEEVHTGSDVNLWEFPSPKWHVADGGRFLGTGDVVITRHPESGWVNLGCYRVQVHSENELGIYLSHGRHGRLAVEAYWAQGKPAPIAISCGHHPLLYMVAGLHYPVEVDEYRVAGGLRGEAISVLPGPYTGLPIPADAEIVAEGEMWPGEERDEGPFGEWSGYYLSEIVPRPLIRVKSVAHRRQPIIFGAAPAKPPNENTFYQGFANSAMVFNALVKAGVPGVKAVWLHPTGGSRLFLVVSIRQMYPGHARQAGVIASHCSGATWAKFVVVVDDDIDPFNAEEVIWALSTRCDPAQDIDVFRKGYGSPLDPTSYPRPQGYFNNRAVIDACRSMDPTTPFPPAVDVPPDRAAVLREKWRGLLF